MPATKKRLITAEDLYRIELLFEPRLAPDGQNVVYRIQHVDRKTEKKYSNLWVAPVEGGAPKQFTYGDQYDSSPRWSPDGKQIAFIRMPDTQTPFPMGELWVMEADGRDPRRLASADAGHGYAAAWSPDSTRIAFVVRENTADSAADQSAGALISNIHMVNIATGQIDQVTRFNEMLIEAPQWSADGHFLAFSVVTLNDTINLWIADLDSGEVKPLGSSGATCCPAWILQVSYP